MRKAVLIASLALLVLTLGVWAYSYWSRASVQVVASRNKLWLWLGHDSGGVILLTGTTPFEAGVYFNQPRLVDIEHFYSLGKPHASLAGFQWRRYTLVSGIRIPFWFIVLNFAAYPAWLLQRRVKYGKDDGDSSEADLEPEKKTAQ